MSDIGVYMFLISLIVFCISVLWLNKKKSFDSEAEYKEFFNEHISLIRHCVYRIGYTSFEIKQNGIFEGKKVWWLFHLEGYKDLSDDQCIMFAKIAIDQLELLHPGHAWSMIAEYYKDNRGNSGLNCIRIFPVKR